MVESGKANNAIIAHLVLGDNGQLRQHLLMDHLKSTANKASEFAAFFGGAEWGPLQVSGMIWGSISLPGSVI